MQMHYKLTKNEIGHIRIMGHLMAAACILVWGCAMISTKALQQEISPEALLFWRFLFGYVTLWVLSPHFLRLQSWKEELICLLCGITGTALYFWCQNVALNYTMASNVSVIIGTSSVFTALIGRLVFKNRKLSHHFLAGFAIAITGVIFVSFNGKMKIDGNMLGNLLALAAAVVWGVYSNAVKMLDQYPALLITRRIFFYGLLSIILIVIGTGTQLQPERVFCFPNSLHVAYIGCLASAVCYGVWNEVFRRLGAVKANTYIYALPIVTIVCSHFTFGEQISIMGIIGIELVVAGLIVSQKADRRRFVPERHKSY